MDGFEQTMTEFDPEMMLEALRVYGFEMSDSGIEPYLKQKIKNFLAEPRATVEVYDFCDYLAKLPHDRIIVGETRFGIDHIDSFGQALFDVTKYYLRPVI